MADENRDQQSSGDAGSPDAPMVIKESRLRSVLKAFSWRIVATTTTTTIAYLTTGGIGTALTIGSIEFFAKIPVYYAHERIWQIAPRGAVRKRFGLDEDKP